MKLTCDLCGGNLQMNLGGQGATCTTCGLTYSIARLREMLTGKTSVTPEPRGHFDYKPEQFVLSEIKVGMDYISGRIQKGGIGLGERIYINHDYEHPYTIRCLNEPGLPDAKTGMWVQLYLKKCPKRVLKKARAVTGDPNPVANAYNYPGSVYEYFAKLLQSEFPQYEIRENVPHRELEIPVSLMFYKGGKPVLAVFLIHSQECVEQRQRRKAVRVLEREGVDCTHFYWNYRNDAPYVVDRVKGALG